MNSQELETLARLKLPVKLFVFNNGGYGSILATQSAFFHRLVGCNPQSGLTFPDVLRLAEAYGLPAVRLDSPRDLASDLRAVLEAPGPCICEIMAIPDEPREPRTASFQRADGSMASRPLEDMYPFLPRDEFEANMIVPPLSE
jgi:acetolactate synthase-1/2/3 large subunit